ncbi:MAG: hypothetical protein ACO3NK_13405 [Prochlorotrichaceae cyanobacterium]|jgi:hypothetical protein
MKNWMRTIANLGVIGLSGLLLFPLQSRQFQQLVDQNQLDVSAEEQRLARERSRLQVLRTVPAFGFDALIADWTLLNFFDYFGDDPLRSATGYDLSPEYFKVILDRNPYFWEAYFFLSASTSLYAAKPEETVALLNEHLPQLSPTLPPQSYLLWRYKATDELLFLGDSDAAKASYQMGVTWARENGSPSALISAESYQQTIDFLNQDPDSSAAQISAWGSILSNAFDENTQKLAIGRIRSLGGDVILSEQGGYSITLPQ